MLNESPDASHKAALHKFGDILRRKRQSCRWNFRAMAKELGVNEEIISQLEVGEDVGTELEREKVCDFLGIDLDTFPRLLRNQKAQVELKIVPLESETVSAGTNVVDFNGYRENGKRPLHIQGTDNPGDDG